MPKNGKPKGGRPSRNFEPRYAKKTAFHDRHAGGRPARDDERARAAREADRHGAAAAGPRERALDTFGNRPAERM